MKVVLARALRALVVSPLNCSLILDAGGLDPLTDMLNGRDQELAHQALVVLSLLSKVWSCPRSPPQNLLHPSIMPRFHTCGILDPPDSLE